MKKELFILGTRPEIIKLAPLILKINPVVLHTGQHAELANEALEIFKIKPNYNLKLMTENQSFLKFIVSAAKNISLISKKIKPTRIWCQGDTATAFAAAISATALQIPLVHVEAGLRTDDLKNPFPEEIFRTFIDQTADVLFAPTKTNVDNLKKEQVNGNIYETGNTIVDALELIKLRLPDSRPIEEKYVLATVHRRESFEKDIYTIFKVFKKLSKKIKIVLPAHPNPNVQQAIHRTGLETIKPLNYLDFLWYLRDCEFVMSDSGGLQEEVPSFQKPILILRKKTERPEILDTKMAFLSNLTRIDLEQKIDKMFKLSKSKIKYRKNPFGDGLTCQRILNLLKLQ